MTGCLDDDVVWRLVRGELAAPARGDVEAHLDTCDDCRAVVAGVARGTEPTASGGRTLGPGDVVGRYVVDGVVGAGAMGAVYAAHDRELDRRVALKLLHDDGEDPAAARDRLWREAQAMARLAHPGVVTVYEVGVAGERVFVAMELVAGETLRAWAARPGRRWPEVVEVIAQVARGLAAAHAAGVIHRDVKPDNVIVGDDGRARIGDFGLARAGATGAAAPGDAAVSVTRTGAIAGTPAYLAPEVLRGGVADARADQFALCVTAYEALAGARPFGADAQTIGALLAAIDAGAAARLPGPRWLDAIVRRGLAARPEARWPSVAALADALDARRRGRRWAWAAGGAAAASAVTAAAVWAMVAPSPPPAPAACDTGGAEIAVAWDDAARARVRRAVVAAAVGGEGWDARVVAALDAWAARWAAAADATCAAARAPAAPAPDVAAARARCLDSRRDDLGAVVARLAAADAVVARRAVDAVAALPAPEECAALVTAADPWPGDPDRRGEAEWAHHELPAARAALAVGDHATAAGRAAELVAMAEASGHAPTIAEARLVHAAALRAGGALPAADEAALASLWAAERGHDDAGAARAWLELAALAGERRDLDEAEARAGHAAAAIARAGGGDALEARLAAAQGLIALARGRHAEALARLDDARARRVAALGEDHVEVSRLDAARATVLRGLGRLGEARAALERVVEVDRARLGPRHPDVARDLHNLGGVLRLAGALDEALARYREALAIERAVLGDAHVDTARTRNSIALVHLARGALDDAEAELRAADGVLAAAGHGERAMVVHNLGLVAQRRGRHADALAAFAEAERLYAASVGDAAEAAARLLVDRAASEAALGERARARASAAAARDRASRLDGAGARAVVVDAEAIVEADGAVHDRGLGRDLGGGGELPPPGDHGAAGAEATSPQQRDVGVYGSAQPWDRQSW